MKDLGNLMQQAKKMQEQMQKQQAELGNKEIVGEAGAGMVRITTNGHGDPQKVEIDASATPGLEEDDRKMLEDMLVAAMTDNHQKRAAESQAGLGDMTGGFDLSGGLGGLFK